MVHLLSTQMENGAKIISFRVPLQRLKPISLSPLDGLNRFQPQHVYTLARVYSCLQMVTSSWL